MSSFQLVLNEKTPQNTHQKNPNIKDRVTLQITAQSNHTLTHSKLKRQVVNAALKALILTLILFNLCVQSIILSTIFLI